MNPINQLNPATFLWSIGIYFMYDNSLPNISGQYGGVIYMDDPKNSQCNLTRHLI